MRFIGIALCLLACAGCATIPAITCDQACAQQGMVCQGQMISSTDGSTMIATGNPRQPYVHGVSSGTSESFMCAKDPNADQAKLSELAAEADEIGERKSNRAAWFAWATLIPSAAVLLFAIMSR